MDCGRAWSLLLCLSVAVTAGGQRLRPKAAALPLPTGRYGIGRQAFDLVDVSRRDPNSADPARRRELMVYVWYPARPADHQARAEYFPDARLVDRGPATKAAAEDVFGAVWPRVVSGEIAPHAVENASPLVRAGGFPVILFSPGSSSSTFSYTAQIEDFVSHGYVAVAIEHSGMSGLVRFPDGRVALFHEPAAGASAGKDPLEQMVSSAMAGTQTAAEDVSFVLDTLQEGKIALGPNDAGKIGAARIMDLQRVAAVGHSAGGTLSVRACQLDSRIKACLSEDGVVNPVGEFFDYPDHTTLRQPVMLIDTSFGPPDDVLRRMGETRAQWREYLAHRREQLKLCLGGGYHVLLGGRGVTHASFSDGLLLSAASGSSGSRVARENLLLTEGMERGFLDRSLKGMKVPMLDKPGTAPASVVIDRIGR